LRAIVRGCIERHVDWDADGRLQDAEAQEKAALISLARTWAPQSGSPPA
jgi:hypothetical protein